MLRVIEAIDIYAEIDAAIDSLVDFAQFDLLKTVIQRVDKLTPIQLSVLIADVVSGGVFFDKMI
jgi:hypothetical protein